jgi:hypothetical protein
MTVGRHSAEGVRQFASGVAIGMNAARTRGSFVPETLKKPGTECERVAQNPLELLHI